MCKSIFVVMLISLFTFSFLGIGCANLSNPKFSSGAVVTTPSDIEIEIMAEVISSGINVAIGIGSPEVKTVAMVIKYMAIRVNKQGGITTVQQAFGKYGNGMSDQNNMIATIVLPIFQRYLTEVDFSEPKEYEWVSKLFALVGKNLANS